MPGVSPSNLTALQTNLATAATFGGGGKAVNPSSPIGGAATASGHHGMSTWGNNDYSKINVDGAGFTGIAAAAIAFIQLGLADAQYSLARDYYNTNKTDFDFYRNNYAKFDQNGSLTGDGGPLVTHKNQAFSTPFYATDYLPMTGAALGRVKVYDEKWFQTRRRLHRYAVGLGKQVDYNFYIMRYRASFAAWVSGRRIEDARKDWKDEQIQTHKVQALNFGITAGNIARQGLASATNALEHAYDEMGSRVGGLSNGLARFSGYNQGREAGQQMLNNSSQSGANMAPHASGV